MLRAGGRGRVLIFLITAACAIDHALSFKAVIVFQRLSSDRWSMCRRCPLPLRSEPTTAGGAGEWEKEARRLQQDLDCAQLRIATLEGQLTEQKALHEADLAELRAKVSRLDGASFALELNMQVKSKQLVTALEQLAETSEELALMREKYADGSPDVP